MAGHDNYHLPHRDLVAGYIEAVAMTSLLDAMVFVPVCDDVIPGHLMAAARLNLPAVVVTGGYMQLNRYKGQTLDPLEIAPRHFADFKDSKINEDDYGQIKEAHSISAGLDYPGVGPEHSSQGKRPGRINSTCFYWRHSEIGYIHSANIDRFQ